MKSSKKTARTSELNKPYPFLKSISCCIVFHDMKGKHLRIADMVLIAFIFAASVSMLLFSSSGASYVQIETPDGIFRYTLSENRTIEAEGEIGITTIQIEDGSVRILSSPCDNKTCMRGSISKYPQMLVCLPNRIVVSMEADRGGEIDAAAF